MPELLLCLTLLTANASPPAPALPGNWLMIVEETYNSSAHASATVEGTFAVQTGLGFVTVAFKGAAAPDRLNLCTGRFLFAPPMQILVGRKNAFLMSGDDNQGIYLPSNSASLMAEASGFDLGLSPLGWANLLAGRLPALASPVAKEADKDSFWVWEKDKPNPRYLISIKEKRMLAAEDTLNGWGICFAGWSKVQNGFFPKSVRLSLYGEEKMVAHYSTMVPGVIGISFLPPLDSKMDAYRSNPTDINN